LVSKARNGVFDSVEFNQSAACAMTNALSCFLAT
jgi:hypothetical protein